MAWSLRLDDRALCCSSFPREPEDDVVDDSAMEDVEVVECCVLDWLIVGVSEMWRGRTVAAAGGV